MYSLDAAYRLSPLCACSANELQDANTYVYIRCCTRTFSFAYYSVTTRERFTLGEIFCFCEVSSKVAKHVVNFFISNYVLTNFAKIIKVKVVIFNTPMTVQVKI